MISEGSVWLTPICLKLVEQPTALQGIIMDNTVQYSVYYQQLLKSHL